ncbi:glycerophosphodiester phosphodiesterase family protein [Sphingobium sp. H39-3-25]|uniref:glycerophosphodiester phosphodiesterase family protein n=1 Tax=Sphingobium arseniciresistens TaxID=3030834 RepID=UPI0023B9B205|nr:glycerophosphodiester phosphodiesterase family protein [Sphingobium arseniciresistens]
MSLSALDVMLAPAPDAGRVAFLKDHPFAHRGLHGGETIENSLSAFDQAIAAGYGMECDVQASLDGIPFVFHDATLDRLTGEKGLLAARPASLLDAVVLSGCGERLPRLEALLARIAGRGALLVEVKASRRQVAGLCRSVHGALAGYVGPVAVMSFNPMVGAWFGRNAPDIVRGLVVTEQGKGKVRGAIERTLALWRAKPDFLAYDIRDLPAPFAARARRRGLPVLTWTVRDAGQEAVAMAHADQIIFEHPTRG